MRLELPPTSTSVSSVGRTDLCLSDAQRLQLKERQPQPRPRPPHHNHATQRCTVRRTSLIDHSGRSVALPSKAAPSAGRPADRSAMQCECARPAARDLLLHLHLFCLLLLWRTHGCARRRKRRNRPGRRRRIEIECGRMSGVECSATEPGAVEGQGGRERRRTGADRRQQQQVQAAAA